MHKAHRYIFTLLCRMDEALYIYFHFYIFLSLFVYFLACHTYIAFIFDYFLVYIIHPNPTRLVPNLPMHCNMMTCIYATSTQYNGLRIASITADLSQTGYIACEENCGLLEKNVKSSC